MSTADSGNAAHDATVRTGTEDPSALHAQRVLYADEAEQAVKDTRLTIRQLKASLKDRDPAGTKAARARIKALESSLKDRQAEATRLRAAAKEKP